jgi:hypothetical protein
MMQRQNLEEDITQKQDMEDIYLLQRQDQEEITCKESLRIDK